MDIKLIASSLLAFRIVATLFTVIVLKRQLTLIRFANDGDNDTLRKVLFALAVVIFCGQFVPIVIDTATIVADVARAKPSVLGVAYAYSNAFTAMISAILLWTVYRVAGNPTRNRRREDR